jgi:prepilin peptidase CpaA
MDLPQGVGMTVNVLTDVCAAVLVLVAGASDIRSRRIPNWLTLSGVCAGLALHAATAGFSGLKLSAMGMLLGFGAYLALYCLHAMGAGDVKLMAAVGAIVGPAAWISVFVATAIAAGLLSLGLVIFKRRLRETLRNAFFIVGELVQFRAPYKRRSDLDVKDGRSLKMPHGVAIAAGTAATLLLARI